MVEITEKTNLHIVASIQGPPDPRRLLWPIHSIAVRLWGRLYSQSADVCIALGSSSVLFVPPLFLQKLKNWPSTQGALFCSASKFDWLPCKCFQFLVHWSMHVRVKGCNKQQEFVFCNKNEWFFWFQRSIVQECKIVIATRTGLQLQT